MAPSCVIRFNSHELLNPGNIFWCGETLRGCIILNLAKPRIMKGVYFTVSGSASCSWSEQGGYSRNRDLANYTGNECYIDSVTYLVGSATSDVTELPAGIHTYSFVFDIPPNLPSSFEGEKGYIRYDVRVTINRPHPLVDDNFKKDLIFVRPFNLNAQIDLFGTPFQKELTHTFCSCCLCNSAPLQVVASIPQIGYIPGQIIIVKMHADNGSDINIQAIKSSLCQNIVYTSDKPVVRKSVELKKVTESIIAGIPNNEIKYIELALNVPTVPPTDEDASKIIHVTYFIEIKFKTNWIHTTPSIIIPITIGTLPLALEAGISTEENIYDNPVTLKHKPMHDEVSDKVEELSYKKIGVKIM